MVNADLEIRKNDHKYKVKMADTACCVRHFFLKISEEKIETTNPKYLGPR
jgi:hypothetical protein